ncbi:MAG: RiPP maturation radical SAM protein 1 [Planctomycetes bacterium]|nr:RiPP maturation radical SAM protein 1 [Planctomycetota bacterium]
MKKVLLVAMPYGISPVMGLASLKPCLTRSGVECDVRYFGLTMFAKYFPRGREGVLWMEHLTAYSSLAVVGDWLFARTLFPELMTPPIAHAMLGTGCRFQGRDDEVAQCVRFALDVADRIPEFLEDCMAAIAWRDYAVVGFTSCFNQTLSSMALAALIKRRYPEIAIVVGGPNADGDMSRALLAAFPQLDYAFKGEAEETFPRFARALLSGDGNPFETPGLVGRHNLRQVVPRPLVRDLDATPFPNFDDFVDQARSLGLSEVLEQFPLEGSRGCWWGEKHHCTFCGLNGQGMAYRRKSPERVLAEVERVRTRFAPREIMFVDNIMDFRYFDSVLPELARRPRVSLYFETKANLPHEKMKIMKEAGVDRIQPGIESLSSSVLALMKKGTTFLQNVECLKNCLTLGIETVWTHLYGFPGETLADYQDIVARIPALHHLPPPLALVPVICERFSPFFERPEALGMAKLRPAPEYGQVYPFEAAMVRELAVFFKYDYAQPRPEGLDEFIAGPVASAIERWRDRYRAGARLAVARIGDRGILVDTREEEGRAWLLDRVDLAILEAFDSPSSAAKATKILGDEACGTTNGSLFLWELLGELGLGEADDRWVFSTLDRLAEIGLRVERRAEPSPAGLSGSDFLEERLNLHRARRWLVSDRGSALSLPERRTREELFEFVASDSRVPERAW